MLYPAYIAGRWRPKCRQEGGMSGAVSISVMKRDGRLTSRAEICEEVEELQAHFYLIYLLDI